MLYSDKNNLKDFVSEIEQFLQDNNVGYKKIGSIEIEDIDRKIITNCIELRNQINNVRNVNHIVKYQRTNGQLVDLKGFTGEFMFSRFVYLLHVNNRKAPVEIVLPAVAEMILNKTKQDVDVTEFRKDGTENKFTFDIKSQFSQNKWQFLTINQKSFNRMKEQSKFFIFSSVNGVPDELSMFTSVDFFIVKNSWYEENSESVDESWKANFTPYRKLPLSHFELKTKLEKNRFPPKKLVIDEEVVLEEVVGIDSILARIN